VDTAHVSLTDAGDVASMQARLPSHVRAAFGSLSLPAGLVEALKASGITKPSEIQQVVIPEIMAGHDIIMAAQTGTGKTLAYLLPIIEKLRYDEDVEGVVTRLNRPRALVLVPTRELAVQVLAVAKFLSHYFRFRSVALTGGIRIGYADVCTFVQGLVWRSWLLCVIAALVVCCDVGRCLSRFCSLSAL